LPAGENRSGSEHCIEEFFACRGRSSLFVNLAEGSVMKRVRCVVRAIGVVVHEGQVLLVASKASPGAWVPPGGKVEAREPLADAVVRETFEETGVHIEVLGLIAYRETWWDSSDALELYFAARPEDPRGGDPGSGPEGRPAKWVAVDDLAGTPHFPEELIRLCTLSSASRSVVEHLGPRDMRGTGR
jgi:8-oxo-dGTP diphosphatase